MTTLPTPAGMPARDYARSTRIDDERFDAVNFLSALRDIPIDTGIIGRPELDGLHLPAAITNVTYRDATTGHDVAELRSRHRDVPFTAFEVGDALFHHPDYIGRRWVEAKPGATTSTDKLLILVKFDD